MVRHWFDWADKFQTDTTFCWKTFFCWFSQNADTGPSQSAIVMRGCNSVRLGGACPVAYTWIPALQDFPAELYIVMGWLMFFIFTCQCFCGWSVYPQHRSGSSENCDSILSSSVDKNYMDKCTAWLWLHMCSLSAVSGVMFIYCRTTFPVTLIKAFKWLNDRGLLLWSTWGKWNMFGTEAAEPHC